jgi:hypothetical protein
LGKFGYRKVLRKPGCKRRILGYKWRILGCTKRILGCKTRKLGSKTENEVFTKGYERGDMQQR